LRKRKKFSKSRSYHDRYLQVRGGVELATDDLRAPDSDLYKKKPTLAGVLGGDECERGSNLEGIFVELLEGNLV
jgi:hypothetical protein